MAKICLLDDHTINKIAAGEVIENPASVVKELVDNALDAGASEITIDIMQGGRARICIRDNGIGMQKEDALLSLQRHATSKISAVEDLFSIDTMGFRGEAIPSIAAISRFSLHTMKENEGTYLFVEGGKLLSIEERGRAQGTSIEVKDLFFNIPVRRKFQKPPTSDVNDVLKCVSKLALANPQTAFELTSDNAVILKTKISGDPKKRIEEVLGAFFLEEAIPINLEEEEITLTGFLGLPTASKPNRLSQHLFINRRPVFSPFIAECIKESYGHALPQGRFPFFVLHISAPKDLIDINVHPQKKEVRLRRFEQFKSGIHKAVQGALFGKAKSTVTINAFPLQEREKLDFRIREEEVYEELFFTPPPQPKELDLPLYIPKREFHLLLVSSEIALIKGSLLGQEEALFTLIDLKAAQETAISRNIQDKKRLELAPFLIPYIFTPSTLESRAFKENLPALASSGIHIREFGEGTFCLEALPTLFGDVVLELFVKDLAQACLEEKGSFIEERLAKKVATSVMRSLAGTRVPSHEEVKSLLAMLTALNAPLFSPSGKPIYASLNAAKAKKVIAHNLEPLC